MIVKELIEALVKMPHNAMVYNLDGIGIMSAKMIHRHNLFSDDKGESNESFCELITYQEEHTRQNLDLKIERETGFQTRDELIEAYKKLLKKD